MQHINEVAPLPNTIASATNSSSEVITRTDGSIKPVAEQTLELRAWLSTSDAKQTATAIIRADVRKVDAYCASRLALEAQVAQKRKDYQWWVALFADKGQQEQLLLNVQTTAERIKSEIALVPVFETLRETSAKYGRRAALLQIVKIITWADAQFNTSHKLTEEQIITIAETVLETYGYLHIEDCAIAVRTNVLHATSPTMRLDTQVVMAWFQKYTTERAARIAESNYNQHLATK